MSVTQHHISPTNAYLTAPRTTDVDSLVDDVCRLYLISPDRLRAHVAGPAIGGVPDRHDVANARRVVAAVMRSAGFSLPAIGRVLDRHHATVLWLLRNGWTPRLTQQVEQLAAKHVRGNR